MHCQEVPRDFLKYARDFIFDPFLRFFPFDSLGAVPENPGTVIRGVRLSVSPIYRGTTVTTSDAILENFSKIYSLYLLCLLFRIYTAHSRSFSGNLLVAHHTRVGR